MAKVNVRRCPVTLASRAPYYHDPRSEMKFAGIDTTLRAHFRHPPPATPRTLTRARTQPAPAKFAAQEV